tara:strand:- start:860 stop:1198 length:339 start_codon:yes stop_codon:yes gene_type:complete
LFNNKIPVIKNTKKETSAFQPARDNPNILNNTSSHLIVDLFNRYVSVSLENSIFDEHPSGPVQKLTSIPKWYNPAIELESQRTPPPISMSFLEIEVILRIKIIIKLYAMIKA